MFGKVSVSYIFQNVRDKYNPFLKDPPPVIFLLSYAFLYLGTSMKDHP